MDECRLCLCKIRDGEPASADAHEDFGHCLLATRIDELEQRFRALNDRLTSSLARGLWTPGMHQAMDELQERIRQLKEGS